MGNTLTVETAKAISKKKTTKSSIQPIGEINEDEIHQETLSQHKPCIPSEKSAFRKVSKKNFRFHRKKVYGNVATDDRDD